MLSFSLEILGQCRWPSAECNNSYMIFFNAHNFWRNRKSTAFDKLRLNSKRNSIWDTINFVAVKLSLDAFRYWPSFQRRNKKGSPLLSVWFELNRIVLAMMLELKFLWDNREFQIYILQKNATAQCCDSFHLSRF